MTDKAEFYDSTDHLTKELTNFFDEAFAEAVKQTSSDPADQIKFKKVFYNHLMILQTSYLVRRDHQIWNHAYNLAMERAGGKKLIVPEQGFIK